MPYPSPFPICAPSRQSYLDDVMASALRDEAAVGAAAEPGEPDARADGEAPAGSCRSSAVRDLDALGPDERDALARELGIPADALLELAVFGEEAVCLTRALGLDPDKIRERLPEVICQLRLVCAACDSKSRCRSELARGRAASSFTAYCPSADTLARLRLAAFR